MREQNNAVYGLAHTKWNCKYQVVFAPKYRRKVFFNEKREDMREILRTVLPVAFVRLTTSPWALKR